MSNRVEDSAVAAGGVPPPRVRPAAGAGGGTPPLLMEPLLLHKEYPLRPPRRQLLLRGERGYRFKKQLRATPGDMIRLAKSFSNYGVSSSHMTEHKLGKPMDILWAKHHFIHVPNALHPLTKPLCEPMAQQSETQSNPQIP